MEQCFEPPWHKRATDLRAVWECSSLHSLRYCIVHGRRRRERERETDTHRGRGKGRAGAEGGREGERKREREREGSATE